MQPNWDSTNELSQKGVGGEIERVHDSNHITEHQVKVGRGGGGSDASTTARQCHDWHPTG